MSQPDPNPALTDLAVLIGDWTTSMTDPGNPAVTYEGRVSFAWHEGGAFLLSRSEAPDSTFPRATMVIGRDDAGEEYTVLYYDSRGVARVYQMSLRDGVWSMWRDAPGFAQRLTGRFSADGRTITAAWEMARDNVNYVHDFDLTYTRTS